MPRAAATARRLAEQFFELVYLDVAGDEAFGVGAEEEADDAEARFGADGGEHVGEAGCTVSVRGRH